MKKSILTIAALCLALCGFAQEKKITFKPYGFVRNYACFDSRDNLSSNSDQFNMIPKDEALNGYGDDLNAKADILLLSITTRLGLNITGPDFLGAKTSAKIESDFAGFGTSNTVLRIRQAYAKLDWEKDNLLVGQAWHPMMGDMMPDVFSLATGAPFTPFSRSPQVRYNRIAGDFTLTATALYQFQYLSYGPNANDLESSTTSFDFARKALVPELYFQAMYKEGGFMAGAGVDILTLKPRTEYTDNNGEKMLSDELLTSFTPTAFFSYKDGNWGIKGRVTYAQNASHLNMLSGYGVTKVKDNGEVEYGSLSSVTAWLDVTYKQQLKKGSLTYCLFGGYGKNLGCEDDFVSSKMMYVRGYKNIDNFWRVSPSVLYTHNAMQIGLEYEPTTVGYGTMKADGSVDNKRSVTNHRICALLKYNF
ncbi:MAG: hypothetical protein IJF00_07215 [Bacteroidaceae bacterium]|nr:hypothetical protein [Bacteroidaceae bacterium]MBQ3121495.1 hypothetical protein [Bacteroidaceae bacterium]